MAGPSLLDHASIERFLAAAAAALEGDWLLIGGAAAAVWFRPERVTADIDLISFAGTNAERLALMNVAASQGLPIETVNTAADYFVHRISDWRAHLVVLHRGPRATIYRPDPTLFLLLKCRRLSEEDLSDCRGLLDLVRRDQLPLDVPRVLSELGTLAATNDDALAARRQILSDALNRGHS